MKRLIICDFDRTLIKTDEFFDEVARIIAQQTGISAEQGEAIAEHLRGIDETADLRKVYAEHGVADLESELEKMDPQSIESDHLYDDAQGFLQRTADDAETDFWIVTSADVEQMQEVKFKRAGISDNVLILTENKGRFIKNTMTTDESGRINLPWVGSEYYEKVTVYDDRYSAISALVGLASFELVILQRDDAKYRIAADEKQQVSRVITGLDSEG